jgi:hypothetical protein
MYTDNVGAASYAIAIKGATTIHGSSRVILARPDWGSE